jgi:serine kinase
VKKQELHVIKNFVLSIKCDFLEPCGSGNYAEVYKIVNRQKNRELALKVMNTNKIGDDYLKNFLPNELKVLRKMQKNRNLVTIYSVKEIPREQRVFIVMEFASKGTLSDWLRDRGALTQQTAKQFLPQILNGVHGLHSVGIAHRDLKLENILLTKREDIKISDFSFSLEVDPKQPLSTQFCGSLPYFPPEILQRKPYNPLIADVWSLGVCFYILLNDGLPFKLGDDDIMLQKQLNKDWSFRKKVEPNVSPDLKDMIGIMLEPKTDIRTTTKDLINKNWFKENLHKSPKK